MTQTSDSSAAPEPSRRRPGGLSSMLLADLKSMASQFGVSGAESMRKAQLVAAIKDAQAAQPAPGAAAPRRTRGARSGAPGGDRPSTDAAPEEAADPTGAPRSGQDRSGGAPGAAETGSARQEEPARQDSSQQGAEKDGGASQGSPQEGGAKHTSAKQGSGKQGAPKQPATKQTSAKQGSGKQGSAKQGSGKQGSGKQGPASQDSGTQDSGQQQEPAAADASTSGGGGAQDDAEDDGRGRNRRRRGRDRNRPGSTTGGGQRNEPDSTILEDDVLVPAAGILDVLDNYAFVRTSGYLAGADDVYLSLSMVRRFGLRRGDAVVGHVRQPREGERKEKFNPMVRIDSVNGLEPDGARERPEFSTLTPLHPEERLRLETGPGDLVGRMVDLAAPIGKGQRGLIVSPPKAGKTTLLKSMAASISANNPECHLMVVLVDERPEEVTDFQRSVKGEVIASTFDRPPGDHTSLAELAIDRAKRLVELGHDVVVLLDGLTRLGRAHNLSTSASGRILSGGVDSTALHPPKRFFGAARNVEDGGSLTILATALVESGSRMDEVIFEEFTGTANMELRLRAELAEHRLFPAVDVVRSGTRHEDLLMSENEVAVVAGLRSSLAGTAPAEALGSVLDRMAATQTNIELLMQFQRG